MWKGFFRAYLVKITAGLATDPIRRLPLDFVIRTCVLDYDGNCFGSAVVMFFVVFMSWLRETLVRERCNCFMGTSRSFFRLVCIDVLECYIILQCLCVPK